MNQKFFNAVLTGGLCVLLLGAAEPNNPQKSLDRNQKLETLESSATAKDVVSETDTKARTEDVEKIQEELKQIIARTQQLQNQVKDDRSEIKRILEQAQIHQRILKGIMIPKTIQSKHQINADQIIAQEKMRLIARQAEQTQNQLKTIQNARLKPPKSSD